MIVVLLVLGVLCALIQTVFIDIYLKLYKLKEKTIYVYVLSLINSFIMIAWSFIVIAISFRLEGCGLEVKEGSSILIISFWISLLFIALYKKKNKSWFV